MSGTIEIDRSNNTYALLLQRMITLGSRFIPLFWFDVIVEFNNKKQLCCFCLFIFLLLYFKRFIEYFVSYALCSSLKYKFKIKINTTQTWQQYLGSIIDCYDVITLIVYILTEQLQRICNIRLIIIIILIIKDFVHKCIAHSS